MTAEYSYSSDGSIRSLKNGGLYTEYAFDANKNLTGLKTMLGTEVLADNHYTYDLNGNRTAGLYSSSSVAMRLPQKRRTTASSATSAAMT